jgi:hypothetical protein
MSRPRQRQSAADGPPDITTMLMECPRQEVQVGWIVVNNQYGTLVRVHLVSSTIPALHPCILRRHLPGGRFGASPPIPIHQHGVLGLQRGEYFGTSHWSLGYRVPHVGPEYTSRRKPRVPSGVELILGPPHPCMVFRHDSRTSSGLIRSIGRHSKWTLDPGR